MWEGANTSGNGFPTEESGSKTPRGGRCQPPVRPHAAGRTVCKVPIGRTCAANSGLFGLFYPRLEELYRSRRLGKERLERLRVRRVVRGGRGPAPLPASAATASPGRHWACASRLGETG